jgi:hypothetical protein
MDIGNVVRFSSHPRPFLVKDSYCSNADCTCNEVFLTFKEISDSGEQLPDPLSFAASVHLDTWQEKDPPSRSPEVAAWVREFLANCPSGRRAEFKASYEEGRRVAKRIAEYTIDPDDVEEGKLVSFADILAEQRALSEGGTGYTYQFLHQGREYLVEDLYCPNPNCDCQTIHLEFFESVSEEDGESPRVSIFQRFQAKVAFDGRLKVLERAKCSLADARALLSAWWKEHRDDLPMLQGRYQEVKEIGQRNLEAEARPLARFRAPLDKPDALPEVFADDRPPEKRRVGRNDPCPCGSGKKYKKCCWRTDAQRF